MSDDLPSMTDKGREQLARILKDNRKGFLGIGRGKNADFADWREKEFGERNRFMKIEYRMSNGSLEYLYHCSVCRHGVRNKMPGMHYRDCKYYREDALAKWMREGATA